MQSSFSWFLHVAGASRQVPRDLKKTLRNLPVRYVPAKVIMTPLYEIIHRMQQRGVSGEITTIMLSASTIMR